MTISRDRNGLHNNYHIFVIVTTQPVASGLHMCIVHFVKCSFALLYTLGLFVHPFKSNPNIVMSAPASSSPVVLPPLLKLPTDGMVPFYVLTVPEKPPKAPQLYVVLLTKPDSDQRVLKWCIFECEKQGVHSDGTPAFIVEDMKEMFIKTYGENHIGRGVRVVVFEFSNGVALSFPTTDDARNCTFLPHSAEKTMKPRGHRATLGRVIGKEFEMTQLLHVWDKCDIGRVYQRMQLVRPASASVIELEHGFAATSIGDQSINAVLEYIQGNGKDDVVIDVLGNGDY